MTGGRLLCVALGGYRHQWTECIESHRAYAVRHGLTYMLVERNEHPAYSPKWLKFHVAEELLRGGSDVFLVDADARILDRTPAFSEVLAAAPEADIFSADGRSGRPNSGVLMLRAGQDSLAADLLRTCIRESGKPIPKADFVTSDGENGHFIRFVRMEPFASRHFSLDERWNRTVPPVRDNDFVAHYTGPMRSHYLASLPRIDFACLEAERHPLCRHFPKLEGVARADLPAALAQVTDLGRLEALTIQFEAQNRVPVPPVAECAWGPLLWRVEHATGWLERPTRLLVERLMPPGGVAIDIGAHVGYYTEQLTRIAGPAGRVVALEPHPRNFAVLRRRMGGRADVYRRAVGDRVGDTVLYEGTGHSNHSLSRRSGASGIPVSGTTLARICSGLRLERLDFLKCDAEGAEHRIFAAAAPLFRSYEGLRVVLEINPRQLARNGASPGMILEPFAEAGLTMRRINDNYTLGPANKLYGRATANYLAMRESAWSELSPP